MKKLFFFVLLVYLVSTNSSIATTEQLATIHQATLDFDNPRINRILDNGVDIEQKTPVNQQTPMHLITNQSFQNWNKYFIRNKNRKYPHQSDRTLKLLIDRGANLNALDKDKKTPFHLAIVNGAINKAAILYEEGADIWIPDHLGNRALHSMMLLKDPVILDRLMYFFQHIIKREDLKRLLGSRNKEGATPLHLGARDVPENLSYIFEYFVVVAEEHVDIQDERGYTAIHEALEKNNFTFAQNLIINGARKDLFDNRGRSPYDFIYTEPQNPLHKFLAPVTSTLKNWLPGVRKLHKTKKEILDTLPKEYTRSCATSFLPE